MAEARDDHYHDPPDYIVLEPEDTKARTRNLQQTNTNGYKWQGTPEQFRKAARLVKGWGADGRRYHPTPQYQHQLRQLINHFPYRLDTNFAKMDRIVHPGVEAFKDRVCGTEINGLTISQWSRLLSGGSDTAIRDALAARFDIREESTGDLLQ